MYEARYARYFTQSEARFAEAEEIKAAARQISAKSRQKQAGIPLYYEDSSYYVDDSDNHTIVVGPTGCKKSRVTVFPTVRSIIAAGESAVINDPKLEIFHKTAAAAKAAGAQVYVLNFRKPGLSHGWNPLRQPYRFHEAGMEDEAQQALADFAASVVAPALEKTVERYWSDATQAVIKGVSMMYMDSVPTNCFHLKNIIPFCYEEQFQLLKKIAAGMDPLSPATFNLKCITDLEAEKTKSCIYSTLLSILASFVQNRSLLQMLCTSSFDYEDLVDQQTLVYVSYPDERAALNSLVSLFFTQCYESLVTYASSFKNDCLPRRVNFVLDEFSNLTSLPGFATRISESRSKNIRYFLFVQSFSQLKEKYRECAETILANCSNWIVFSSKETDFLQKLSEICGHEVDYHGIEHPLISAYELQHLQKKEGSAELLVIKQGQYPYITTLPDCDYQTVFEEYPPAELPKIEVEHTGQTLSIDAWVRRVDRGIKGFRFPYPIN